MNFCIAQMQARVFLMKHDKFKGAKGVTSMNDAKKYYQSCRFCIYYLNATLWTFFHSETCSTFVNNSKTCLFALCLLGI